MPADLTLPNAAPTFGSHFLARQRPDGVGPSLLSGMPHDPIRFGFSDDNSSPITRDRQRDQSPIANGASPQDSTASTPTKLRQSTLSPLASRPQLPDDVARSRRQYRERSESSSGSSSPGPRGRRSSSTFHTLARKRLGLPSRYSTVNDESDEDSSMELDDGEDESDEDSSMELDDGEDDSDEDLGNDCHRSSSSETETEEHCDTASQRRAYAHFGTMPRIPRAPHSDDRFPPHRLPFGKPVTTLDEAGSDNDNGRISPSTGPHEYDVSDLRNFMCLALLNPEREGVFEGVANTISEDRTGTDDAVVGKLLAQLDTEASRRKRLLSAFVRADNPVLDAPADERLANTPPVPVQQMQPNQNQMPQTEMQSYSFASPTDQAFNLDFTTLDNTDILDTFDFDSFLNTSTDDAFNFDSAMVGGQFSLDPSGD